VPAHTFPANPGGFFVKNSCRTTHLAASPPGQRGNAAPLYACEFLPEIRPNYSRKYVYMTYGGTTREPFFRLLSVRNTDSPFSLILPCRFVG
jgi:hypothetical protein